MANGAVWRCVVASCVLGTTGVAWAQEAGSAPAAQPAPVGGDQAAGTEAREGLAVFVLERGLYVSSDMGVFFAFGGVNGYSNVQPYLAVNLGYDIGDYFGLQVGVSSGHVATNPISEADLPGAGGQETGDYSLLNFGLTAVGAIRPTERFAIEPKLGGGMTRVYPALTDPDDPSQTLRSFAPHVLAGVDLKYLTLLTHFTAGISPTVYYIVGPNVLALAGSVVVRYTF